MTHSSGLKSNICNNTYNAPSAKNASSLILNCKTLGQTQPQPAVFIQINNDCYTLIPPYVHQSQFANRKSYTAVEIKDNLFTSIHSPTSVRDSLCSPLVSFRRFQRGYGKVLCGYARTVPETRALAGVWACRQSFHFRWVWSRVITFDSKYLSMYLSSQ